MTKIGGTKEPYLTFKQTQMIVNVVKKKTFKTAESKYEIFSCQHQQTMSASVKSVNNSFIYLFASITVEPYSATNDLN